MSRPADPGERGERGEQDDKTLLAKAQRIELLVLDVDGVLTDGLLWYDAAGEALKAISVRDGHGLVMLREEGIRFAILSGRAQPLLQRRFEELRCVEVIERCYRKQEVIAELAERQALPLVGLAFMGDDVNDLGALAQVGLSAAPADAAPELHAQVDLLSKFPGGRGAVRELCELILRAKGKWPPA